MLRGEPPSAVFDENYWLAHCEGFEVRTQERRLGAICEVRFLSRLDRPDELVVRGGFFGNHEEVVPVDEVVEIAPLSGRLLLRSIPDERSRQLPRLRLRRA